MFAAGRISLAICLNRINQREAARCGCDLGNQTVNHILLGCPLLQDERDWIGNALSDRGVAFQHYELLTRPEGGTIIAESIVIPNQVYVTSALDLF